MTNKIPVWIDVDTGVDDSAALLVACKLPQLDIRGISACAGNVERCYTFENTRRVMALAGREDIPVYPGAENPLFSILETAPLIHGTDGLAGAQLPPSSAPVETKPAWDAMYEAAVAAEGELQVISVGPLTDLALAFQKYPELKKLIKRILIMGGAAKGGNTTPAAEFNILGDPHAAQMVFKSGVQVVMCGLDVTMQAYLTHPELAKIENYDSDVCRFLGKAIATAKAFYAQVLAPIVCLHDVCPVLFAAYPHIFSGEEAGVYVETRGTITQGKTVTDLWSDKQFPEKNAFVVLDVDREAFAGLVVDILTSY